MLTTAAELIGWILAGVVAFVVVVALLLTLAVGIAYAWRGRWALREGLPSSELRALLLLVLREARAQMRIIAWTVLRRGSGEIPGRIGTPVILIHGLAADGTSMWALRRSLDALGRPTWSPHLGTMFRNIEAYAERLAPVMQEAIDKHPEGDGVDVVCHSMGGIVLRACLASRPDIAKRVRHIVSIASPHEGTVIATGIPTAEARQLFRGAPWLLALPTLPQLCPQAHITCIASRHDAVVYPFDTSRVAGASWHELDHVGHAELLVAPAVIDLVVKAVS